MFPELILILELMDGQGSSPSALTNSLHVIGIVLVNSLPEEIVVRSDEEAGKILYDENETCERQEDAQLRFDRLARRPPSDDEE